MPVLKLKGCHYEPLGDYHKALGIFRLIAEQLDPSDSGYGLCRPMEDFA